MTCIARIAAWFTRHAARAAHITPPSCTDTHMRIGKTFTLTDLADMHDKLWQDRQ